MLFKRLFIGLLILSALTAEGMAFFNSALVPLQNYMADLYSAGDKKDTSMAGVLEENTYAGSVRYKITAFIPLEEILQTRDNNDGSFCFLYSFLASELFPSYSLVALQATGVKIVDIPLNGSDISPPFL